ncbi:acyl-CoA-binding domain-containing protein 4 isoform X2 [Polyodon spathula]|uniref:acyl-CoA-binding domain-containing protein 4 isoform X1 n=1 Tax=Polyodon spathula TaxID=7913 RepID=UPI001B7E91DF|nr:acyl-CoA-binding domain-containing protein 4 isoform X1 [Polyodon spathula]XP_041087263.1 acyl-CoA-binding domain-containing protein 4 isoform X2 [Polyodon spathula]
MAVADQDCERRFQAAVSVVHSLPKNGLYQPSHKVMLRFYSFYKQATCGPCTAPRPGFWDPIGRYKRDAWKRLGDTSREGAMREYVEEMKRVAQEVIDTVPMNEKTASMFHHFQPLYRVIHDMPRPPDTLLQQIGDGGAEFNQESNHVTSDSESEVFCDSMEQLDPDKQGEPWNNSSASELQSPLNPVAVATQAGAGQGGERTGQGEGELGRKKGALRDGRQSHWSERQRLSSGSLARDERGIAGAGGGGPERGHCGALEQQITLALRRLQEDMHCAKDRLHALEQRADMQQGPSWWLPALSGRSLLFLLIWPFLTQWMTHLLRRGYKKVQQAA